MYRAGLSRKEEKRYVHTYIQPFSYNPFQPADETYRAGLTHYQERNRRCTIRTYNLFQPADENVQGWFNPLSRKEEKRYNIFNITPFSQMYRAGLTHYQGRKRRDYTLRQPFQPADVKGQHLNRAASTIICKMQP